MTPAIAVAAVLAFSFALGSLIMQVDGAKLRRWRLSRRWDVSRLAREFIEAADEPLATLRGLKHMINAWERGARTPSERYWLLYLRVFPECANGETSIEGQKEPADQPRDVEINATAASIHNSEDPQDIPTLVATVRALEQRIAGLSRRVDELSRDAQHERQPRQRSVAGKTRSRAWRSSWAPLYLCTAFVPSLEP
jgi:hypothetical protein